MKMTHNQIPDPDENTTLNKSLVKCWKSVVWEWK